MDSANAGEATDLHLVAVDAAGEQSVELTFANGNSVEVPVYCGPHGERPTRMSEILMSGQSPSGQPYESMRDPQTGEAVIIRRIIGGSTDHDPASAQPASSANALKDPRNMSLRKLDAAVRQIYGFNKRPWVTLDPLRTPSLAGLRSRQCASGRS